MHKPMWTQSKLMASHRWFVGTDLVRRHLTSLFRCQADLLSQRKNCFSTACMGGCVKPVIFPLGNSGYRRIRCRNFSTGTATSSRLWTEGSKEQLQVSQLLQSSEFSEDTVCQALSLYAQLLDDDPKTPTSAVCLQQLLRMLVSFRAWVTPAMGEHEQKLMDGRTTETTHPVVLNAKPLTGSSDPLLLMCSSSDKLSHVLPDFVTAAVAEGMTLRPMGSATVSGATAIVEFFSKIDPKNGIAIAFDPGTSHAGGGVRMTGENALLLGMWARCIQLEHELAKQYHHTGNGDHLPWELISALMLCDRLHVVQKDGGIVAVPQGHMLVLTSPDVSFGLATHQGETVKVFGVTPSKLLMMVEDAKLPGLAFTIGSHVAAIGEEPRFTTVELSAKALAQAEKLWKIDMDMNE